MNTRFITGIALATSLLAACFGDKGNYRYTEISMVEVAGLEDSYTCMSMQDVLRVAPGISSNHPDDTFDCLWTMHHEGYTDTIGKDAILEYPVNKRQGSYDIRLRVTNRANGHATFHATVLHVVTRFSIGYYILKDAGGYTELDLHLPDGDIAPDLLEKATGTRVNGEPRSLGLSFAYQTINTETMTPETSITLNVCTGEELRVMQVEEMRCLHTHDDLFIGDVPDGEIPYFMNHSETSTAYLSNKGVYCIPYSSKTGKLGFPLVIDGDCRPNPRSVVVGPILYFFDDLNGRFLRFNGAGVSGGLVAFSERGPGNTHVPHSPNNIPHELLYFGHNFTVMQAHEGYAIFADRQVAGKRYLYRLTLDSSSSDNPVTSVSEINHALLFNTATTFATNELDARLVYFLHGNGLHAYDVELGTEQAIPLPHLSPGEEITYISNRYYNNPGDRPAHFNYFAIATHRAGRYKVYLHEMRGGKPDGAPARVLEGDGRVTKMQYITSKFSKDPATLATVNHVPLSM